MSDTTMSNPTVGVSETTREKPVNGRHTTDESTDLPDLPGLRDAADPDDRPTAEQPAVGAPEPAAGTSASAQGTAERDPVEPDATEREAALDRLDGGVVDLDEDPFDDDLAEQLEQRAPRFTPNRLTLVLAAALLVVAGFVGGSLSQKQWGGGSTTPANPFTAARGGPSGFPGLGASGGPGGFGGQASAAASITGTVKLVDGTTVYIVTSDGRVITVKTSGSTSVQVAQKGSLADLSAGSTVTISGEAGADGTVTASTITRAR